MRRFQFHTPIAALFELVNEMYRVKDDPGQAADVRFATETAVSLVQPYAPHVAEELWERLGHERLWQTPWPEPDPAMLERETFELVVQVNGKVRDRVEVGVELSEAELIERAKELPNVQAQLDGKEVRRAIVVPRQARQPGRLAPGAARARPRPALARARRGRAPKQARPSRCGAPLRSRDARRPRLGSTARAGDCLKARRASAGPARAQAGCRPTPARTCRGLGAGGLPCLPNTGQPFRTAPHPGWGAGVGEPPGP